MPARHGSDAGELAAKEMTMPKLHDWLVALLQQDNLPVGQGIEQQTFSIMDRQRLKNWQRQFHEEINSIRQIILRVSHERRRPKTGAEERHSGMAEKVQC